MAKLNQSTYRLLKTRWIENRNRSLQLQASSPARALFGHTRLAVSLSISRPSVLVMSAFMA